MRIVVIVSDGYVREVLTDAAGAVEVELLNIDPEYNDTAAEDLARAEEFRKTLRSV